MNKQELFSELSIKIAILEAKIDKLLQLAMKDNTVNIIGDVTFSGGVPTDQEFTENFK